MLGAPCGAERTRLTDPQGLTPPMILNTASIFVKFTT